MAKRDPRIDAYIAKAADFAQPILTRIREAVHAGADVEETMKWSSPTFMYGGRILCGMAAFRQHCNFLFWPNGRPTDSAGKGIELRHLHSISDLPSKKVLTDYVRQARQIHDRGDAPAAKVKAAPRKTLATPADLAAALKKNKKAAQAFENFSPSHKREYIEWIIEAKREETRSKRIAQAIEWMADGKSRNWKYQ